VLFRPLMHFWRKTTARRKPGDREIDGDMFS